MEIKNEIIEIDFLKIPEDTNYWFVRSGKGAEFYTDFKINNYIAIGDNEVTLETLNDINDKFKEVKDTFIAEYKKIYNLTYLNLLKDSKRYQSLDLSEQTEAEEKEKRSSTIAAIKSFAFIEEMSIGDYVLVPYKSSSNFLIGIILSDPYSNAISHQYLGEDNQYNISDYQKKRTVYWIKEILFKELPDQLNWILTGHRAIFDISENANDINPLLSNHYIYKDKAHLRIDVGTEEKVDSKTWLNYQKLIVDNSMNQSDDLYQKNKVQSRGQTILEIAQNNWQIIALVGAALFTTTEYEYKGFKQKWHAPLSFLVPGHKKRKEHEQKLNELAIKEKEIDIHSKKLDVENKSLQNTKLKIELEQIYEKESLSGSHENTLLLQGSIKKSPEHQEALEKMEISNKPIGREISNEMQMDNLYLRDK